MQPLYGREEVVGRARAALARAARGEGRLLLFTGEPGIGKSRLAEQVASDALSQGWAVAWGRCWEAGGRIGRIRGRSRSGSWRFPARRRTGRA